jgi:N-acetylneuraminic acid mutarotase
MLAVSAAITGRSQFNNGKKHAEETLNKKHLARVGTWIEAVKKWQSIPDQDKIDICNRILLDWPENMENHAERQKILKLIEEIKNTQRKDNHDKALL